MKVAAHCDQYLLNENDVHAPQLELHIASIWNDATLLLSPMDPQWASRSGVRCAQIAASPVLPGNGSNRPRPCQNSAKFCDRSREARTFVISLSQDGLRARKSERNRSVWKRAGVFTQPGPEAFVPGRARYGSKAPGVGVQRASAAGRVRLMLTGLSMLRSCARPTSDYRDRREGRRPRAMSRFQRTCPPRFYK
jgi:hypothetical protein